MPAEQGFRLHEQQRAAPSGIEPREQDHHESVAIAELRSFHRALQHDHLLPEKRVFRDELRLRPRQVEHRAGEQTRVWWTRHPLDDTGDRVAPSRARGAHVFVQVLQLHRDLRLAATIMLAWPLEPSSPI